MLKTYRLFMFLTCLITVSAGIIYSSMALMSLSEYKYPGKVVLISLTTLFLSIMIIPGLLAGALGTELSDNDDSEKGKE